jgi:hypothetical protein
MAVGSELVLKDESGCNYLSHIVGNRKVLFPSYYVFIGSM